MPELYQNNNTNQTGIATLLNLVQAVNGLDVDGTAGWAAITAALGTINTTIAAAFPPVLTGSKTYDPGSIANGAQASTTVTVAGAVLGDYADGSFSLDLVGLQMTAYVSATDTVTALFQNNSGGAIDLASGTLRARVWHHA